MFNVVIFFVSWVIAGRRKNPQFFTNGCSTSKVRVESHQVSLKLWTCPSPKKFDGETLPPRSSNDCNVARSLPSPLPLPSCIILIITRKRKLGNQRTNKIIHSLSYLFGSGNRQMNKHVRQNFSAMSHSPQMRGFMNDCHRHVRSFQPLLLLHRSSSFGCHVWTSSPSWILRPKHKPRSSVTSWYFCEDSWHRPCQAKQCLWKAGWFLFYIIMSCNIVKHIRGNYFLMAGGMFWFSLIWDPVRLQ